MSGLQFHVWKKDIRAALIPWGLYILGVGITQFLLVRVTIPDRGIWLQLTCWVFGGWIFHERLKEDSPASWDTRWIASRPFPTERLTVEKTIVLGTLVLTPLVIVRFGASILMGFGFASALLSAVAAIPIPLSGGYLLLIRHEYFLLPRHHTLFLVTVAGSAILSTFHPPVTRESSDLPLHSLASTDTPPHPSRLLSPWFYTDLPDQRIILKSTFNRTLTYNTTNYRREGQIDDVHNDERWFWFAHHQFPNRGVKTLQLWSLTSGSTKVYWSEMVDGQLVKRTRETELPEEIQNTRQTWESKIQFEIGEVTPVWSGPFDLKRHHISQHIRGTIEGRESGSMKLTLWGSRYTVEKGRHQFPQQFQTGGAAVLVESGPESMILVMRTDVQVEDTGFPPLARKVILTFSDPRPFFSPGMDLKLTVLGATIDGRTFSKGPMEVLIRDDHSQNLLSRALDVDYRPEKWGRNSHSSNKNLLPIPSGSSFGQRLDETLKGQLLVRLTDPNRPVNYRYEGWESIQKDYNPDNPQHRDDVLSRVAMHPFLFDWLPETHREQGAKRLRKELQNLPVLNPMAVLHLADQHSIPDIPNLGWCFEFSNRLHGLHINLAHTTNPMTRCPVRFLNLVPEKERNEVWASTWERVRIEESFYAQPATPPGYFLEALRRNSPQSTEAACLYLRKFPEKQLTYKHHLEDLQQLINELRSRYKHPGSEEEFLDWFRREGFLIGETLKPPRA